MLDHHLASAQIGAGEKEVVVLDDPQDEGEPNPMTEFIRPCMDRQQTKELQSKKKVELETIFHCILTTVRVWVCLSFPIESTA